MRDEVYFSLLARQFGELADELNRLDAAVGDGDHGSTMLRGLSKALEAENGARSAAFMRAAGGASGTLFGLILHEIEMYLGKGKPSLGEGLARATDRIMDLGRVRPGDKSMIDALAPAAEALTRSESLTEAIAVAVEGRDATRLMAAQRGRAQYVENAGMGHVDPGAVSVVYLLEVLNSVMNTK